MNGPDNKLINDIINRFHGKRCSAKVRKNFYLWLLSEGYFTAKDKAMLEVWDNITVPAGSSVYTSLDSVKAKLGMTNKGNTSSFAPSRHNIAVKVAAVLAPVVLLIGAYFIYDASVGSGKMLYAEADYGETVKCELADGTVVWLNAGSSLEYPSRFGGGKRQVKLDGEGYFNVTSNRRKPFVVVSDNLRTEVVGTEFNICSYDNHRHESVTVLSGEVNVFTKGDRKFNLSPDEHLVHWKSGGSTDVTQVDAPVMISWMNKGLVFENSTVEDILMGLQRTYDLRVMADPNYLTGTQYSVKFVNGESLYEILSVIRKLTGVPCRLAGGTLFMGDNTGGLYELDGRK